MTLNIFENADLMQDKKVKNRPAKPGRFYL
jgi:hypothetical protein